MLVLAKSDAERAGWTESAARFQETVLKRTRELRSFLRGAAMQPAVFDAAGIARPNNWESRVEAGNPMLRKEEGTTTRLVIDADGPGSIGSWRWPVYLNQGRYALEAKAQWETPRVVSSPVSFRAGVCPSDGDLVRGTAQPFPVGIQDGHGQLCSTNRFCNPKLDLHENH